MAPKNNISKFSNSLTDYLIEVLSDKNTSARQIAQRYNNLKVFMDPEKVVMPHFYVAIGISEACFSIEDGKKIEGALGGTEDNYVARWAGRATVQSELKQHWKLVKDAIEAEEEAENMKKRQEKYRLRHADEINQDMNTTDYNTDDN